MAMTPGLTEWIDILTKLGFPTSAVIMGIWAWLERRDRISSDCEHREDMQAVREEMKEALKESIQSNQNVASVVSTLTSLLGAPRKGRG